jgi:hypothetical protein
MNVISKVCSRMRCGFGVTFWAVEPLLAAGCSNGDLSIEDVLAWKDVLGSAG